MIRCLVCLTGWLFPWLMHLRRSLELGLWGWKLTHSRKSMASSPGVRKPWVLTWFPCQWNKDTHQQSEEVISGEGLALKHVNPFLGVLYDVLKSLGDCSVVVALAPPAQSSPTLSQIAPAAILLLWWATGSHWSMRRASRHLHWQLQTAGGGEAFVTKFMAMGCEILSCRMNK